MNLFEMETIEYYTKEVQCTYKGETYSVRDNGAVMRHARDGQRKRKLDEVWAFGQPNTNGYLHIGTHRVHIIVATAFIGPPPTPHHVVDHIDTNRWNNRPENLRWLTRLENALNNPITRHRIELCCGSIGAFIENPSILNDYCDQNPNFSWMRTVTPQEAKNAHENLMNWAKTHNKPKPKSERGTIGEWIYQKQEQPHDNSSEQFEEEPLIQSLTSNAVQKKWKTPCDFPNCPQKYGEAPLEDYMMNLVAGSVFNRNQYGEIMTLETALSEDKSKLWVMGKSADEEAIKPWVLSEVTYEDGKFVHANLGSFFREDGAQKRFTLVQGKEWVGGDVFDDFC